MTATPLSFSSVEADLIQGVNLIPEARREARGLRQRLRAWGVICGACLLVLIAAWAAAQRRWAGRHPNVRARLDKVEATIQTDRARTLRLRSRLSAASATLAANRRLAHQPDWSLLLGLISDRLGDQTVLASCELTPQHASSAPPPRADSPEASAPGHRPTAGGYLLQLTGFGRSHAAVLAYVRRLEKTTLFGKVKLLDADERSFQSGEAIAFRIRCTLPRLTKGH